ncbi:threonine--tRNA ligase [candidate division KSB1 bacterium]
MSEEEQTQNIEKKRHSLAHVLAAAVLKHDPEVKIAIGPSTDVGFYYDFEFSEGKTLGEDNLKKLEKEMRNVLKRGFDPECKEVSVDEARAIFKDQPYKLELIEEIQEKTKESGEKITTYTIGDFTDLCEGPHVANSKEIKPDSFSLSHIAGAYWRGDEKNTMLTRIYGVAFNTKEELDTYLEQQEEAKKRDHRKLGRELDLFTFSDVVGKGLPLWTPKGSIIRRELEKFIVDEETKRGYQHVYTPDIAKLELYEKSGHYPHYKDSMYSPIEIDDEKYMLRPMTCPHHYELYLSKPHSYRELPMRIAELAKLYRYEQSGELSGLIRVRSFCLADAHIICADEEQAVEEIGNALELIEYISNIFGLKLGENYWYRLSLGDRKDTEKYFKNDEAWEKGEDLLRKLLKKRGSEFVEAEGEAAFYGPKIDVQMRNVNGKEDTAFTVQYDFCMPERFNLTYTDKDGEDKQAFVVHRSSVGAIERIIAFLIEHYAGAFPLWLSPVQVSILPISDAHLEYAKEVTDTLKEQGIRVELDTNSETLGKKIRNVKLQKTPYFLVIGDEEVNKKEVTLESRDEGKVGSMTTEALIEKLSKEIGDKK